MPGAASGHVPDQGTALLLLLLLLLLVPAAEPAVGRHRARLDASARDGVPAHLTVLYPFLPPELIDADVLELLSRLCCAPPPTPSAAACRSGPRRPAAAAPPGPPRPVRRPPAARHRIGQQVSHAPQITRYAPGATLAGPSMITATCRPRSPYTKIKSADAYLVVTPEYNHSAPGGLKNAIDSVWFSSFRLRAALAATR